MPMLQIGRVETTSDAADRADGGLLVSAALLVFTVAFLLIFQAIESSDNAIHYVSAVQDETLAHPSFYPPHLLHAPIIGVFNSLFSTVPGCDVFCAGKLHSIFWAAIAIVSIFHIARILLGSIAGALAASLTLLVAHGFWVYATQAEVYVPMVGCFTAATALLLTNRAPTLGIARLMAVVGLWALATMYHLASVVLFIPFCVYFFGAQGRHGWWQFASVCALAGGTVLITFIIAYVWVGETPLAPLGFLEWVLEIANRPMTSYGFESNPLGFGDLVRAVWSQIKALTLMPAPLTLPLAPPLDQLPLAVVGALAIGAVLLWNLVRVVQLGRDGWPRLFLLLMFAVFFVFFSWWQTSVHKFYIPSSVPLILLTALALADFLARVSSVAGRRWVGGTVAVVIVVMFAFNLSSVLELKKSRGPFHAEAAILNELTPANCTIYSVGQHLGPLKVYFDRTDTKFVVRLEREFYLLYTGQYDDAARLYEGETCAVVALGWVTEQRFDKTIKGYHDATAWPDYIAYLLDARPAADGAGITHNPFELVVTDALAYLVIDRQQRIAVPSIEAATATIRTAEERLLAENWSPEVVAEWGDELLQVPRTDLAIGRDRNLIFGYSWGDFARNPVLRANLVKFGLK